MKLLLFFTVSCWMFVDSESAVQKNITAVEGGNVTLTCKATNDKMKIRVVEWTRPDLKDQDIFLFRDGQFDPDNHPSYKNRVNLQDRNMKNGDVSLILEKVAFNDSGTFQCYIMQRGENIRNKRSASHKKLTSIISLTVDPPGQEGRREDGGREDGGREDGGRGGVGLIVGLTVAALVVVVVVVVMVRRQKMKKSPPPLPPAGSDPDQDKPLNQFDSERLTEVC